MNEHYQTLVHLAVLLGVDGIEAGLTECAEHAESRWEPKGALVANVLRDRTHYSPHNYLYSYLERWN